MSVRAFPFPQHAAPTAWDGRWCRWCGEPIRQGAKSRGWHDGRGDEPDCAYEYRLHTRRADQFRYVERRDGLKCWDCGAEPMKWLRGVETYIGGRPGGSFWKGDAEYMHATRYCSVEYVTALEMEHTVPLWSTTHLTDDERRPYFGPENLRLRCVACHKPKTRAEAGARAKTKRQTTMRLDVPREPSKRPLKSRASWPKGRKLHSRNTFASKRDRR